MLFLLALCAIYQFSQWKQILILVTAFTVGHSVTLAMAALDIISLNRAITEFSIAATIFLTAIYNIFWIKDEHRSQNLRIDYVIALVFGFIHGMGFSNQFKALLSKNESIVSILLPFNIGIELGQIILVIGIIAVTWVAQEKLGVKWKIWKNSISAIAGILAFIMMVERFGDL